MSTDREKKRVHFRGPERIIEKADALADVLEKDRTDVIVEALREYIDERTSTESFEATVAELYYEDELAFETVRTLVGRETAHRFRLLERGLADDPVEIPPPDTDVDVYDGDRESVSPTDESSPE